MNTQTRNEAAIVIDDVSRRFGKTQAITHVSLSVSKGELFGVLGPDGAGKSTLLRMIAAVLDPSDPMKNSFGERLVAKINPPKDHIKVMGFDTVGESEQVKARLGYMPQAFGLYGDLSVDENLTFATDVFGVTGQARIERVNELMSFAGLERFRERRAALLSGGMKKKLALACSLLHRPDVLLLDEPTTGVDPVARREFWDLLSGLHGQGITTVVSTPYMDEAERCNRVILLYEGHILAEGTPQAIKAMIPGKVLAIKNVDMRQAETALRGMPDIIDLQTYGDQLNLIVTDDIESVKASVIQKLSAVGLSAPTFETTPIRMEEAFIYLVNVEKGGSQ